MPTGENNLLRNYITIKCEQTYGIISDMERFIGYFHTSATEASHRKVTGACRAAHERGWSILRFDTGSTAQIRERLRYWQPDGCIVDAVAADRRVFRERVFAGIPTVFIDCDPRFVRTGKSCILQDADAIANAAAKELVRHPMRTFAYAAWPGRPFWSETRGAAFSRAMKRHGIKVHVFRSDNKPYNRTSVVSSLAGWLRTLLPPIGIFTSADPMSEQVLEAAKDVGLSVPDDVMIIGVDNDDFFCDNTRPTLSSITTDFEAAGRLSVEILAKLIANPHRKPIQIKLSHVQMTTRSSSRRTNRQDRQVSLALDLIRERATSGLSSCDVLEKFSCSRRLAEQRFKAIAGRTILDEIHAVQVEHAKRLIAHPFQKLSTVPQLCGHPTAPSFQKLFKRIVGVTMSEYRQQLAHPQPH